MGCEIKTEIKAENESIKAFVVILTVKPYSRIHGMWKWHFICNHVAFFGGKREEGGVRFLTSTQIPCLWGEFQGVSPLHVPVLWHSSS